MLIRNLLAYQPDGRHFAVGDGRELLVYDAPTQEPRWQNTCMGTLVGLGTSSTSLVTVEDNGTVTQWDWSSRTFQWTLPLGQPALGLAVAENGTVAVLLADAVAVVLRGTLTARLPISGASAAGWSGSGTHLVIGTLAGTLTNYSVNGAGLAGTGASQTLPGGVAVRCLAWNADGLWMATAGDTIWKIAGDTFQCRSWMTKMPAPAEMITCSPEGSIIAFSHGTAEATALNLVTGAVVASVEYIDRTVSGLAFGPPPFLAIGMDRGDANLVNLSQQQLCRTEPHPGRDRTRWLVKLGLRPNNLPTTYLAGSPSTPSGPASASRQVAPKPVPTAGDKFPGWVGLVLGPAIGGGMALSVARDMPPDQIAMMVLGGAFLGLLGGIVVWLWDRMGKRSP